MFKDLALLVFVANKLQDLLKPHKALNDCFVIILVLRNLDCLKY